MITVGSIGVVFVPFLTTGNILRDLQWISEIFCDILVAFSSRLGHVMNSTLYHYYFNEIIT